VEIDPVHRRDSSHGLRQRYGARKLRAAFTSAGSSRARSRLRLQARGFCHEVRIDSIRPCRWASGLVGPDVYRPDNVARRAASKVFATEPEQVGSRQSREAPPRWRSLANHHPAQSRCRAIKTRATKRSIAFLAAESTSFRDNGIFSVPGALSTETSACLSFGITGTRPWRRWRHLPPSSLLSWWLLASLR
jgi:hypothetical protein